MTFTDAYPAPKLIAEVDKVVRSSSGGTITITLPMNSNDIVLVKLAPGKKGK